MPHFILTLSCADKIGIVAAVTGYLAANHCNIADSAQFGDPQNNQFFMRVTFQAPLSADVISLSEAFESIAAAFAMQWAIHDRAVAPRVVIMVSKSGHCLNDLLYRRNIGSIPMDVRAVISNHRDYEQLAAQNDIPFHHLPVEPTNKLAQEEHLVEILAAQGCELLILARYMQVLSPRLCARLSGRVINIHHSFLPSFQGAKPYHQAHVRGVKLIGATAHFVTEDLDEGPIIEQDVARVDHNMNVTDYVAAGRDVECAVLARAVKWQVEHRILLNGHSTVVFR